MVVSKLNNKTLTLQQSFDQLSHIANAVYNEDIRPIALEAWKKQLKSENPQWKFMTRRAFYESAGNESAHAMAMVDRRLPGKGLVGYFACTNSDIGAKALTQAFEWLKTKSNISEVYGPINGTLPNDYRLNLSDDYTFPGEPINPSWHIDAFYKAGFTVFNRYASGRLKHFNFWLKLTLKKPHKKDGHIAVRRFSNKDYDKDFKIYHDLRNQIFPFQSTYCPAISIEERAYNSSGKFDPQYTYFLTDHDREVGFVMAYTYKKQLILKTIGLLPEYRGRRLSSLLLKPIHEQAAKEGITTAIYGMVRVGNKVHKNKHPLAKVFRKYVTMHKNV